MSRRETFNLILILGLLLLGCDKPRSDTPIIPEPIAENATAKTKKNTGSSFLAKRRDRIDHDAKFQPRVEIDPNFVIFSDFHSPKPLNWSWEDPKSTHRIANYILLGSEEVEHAELVIKQIPNLDSMDLNASIERWKNQFRSDGGGPVRPVISKTFVAGFPTTIVEITGEYMGIGASFHKYKYTMLLAVIEYEKGNLILRVIGPSETIQSHRNSWNTFLEQTTHTNLD